MRIEITLREQWLLKFVCYDNDTIFIFLLFKFIIYLHFLHVDSLCTKNSVT